MAQQLEEIVENDERLSEPTLDEVLADRQKHMSCTDWEKAQDVDPAIKRMKELMEKFGNESPNMGQPTSEIAEVKGLCDD